MITIYTATTVFRCSSRIYQYS